MPMTDSPNCVTHADMKGVAWAYRSDSRSHIRPVCQSCLGEPKGPGEWEWLVLQRITADEGTWELDQSLRGEDE